MRAHYRTRQAGLLGSCNRHVYFAITFVLGMLFYGTSEPEAAPEGKQESIRHIEIIPATSQAQITIGSGLSIVANIQNKSNVTVYLHPHFFTLTPPSEVTPCEVVDDWWAMIPSGPAQDGDSNRNNTIALAPGARTTAFWGLPKEYDTCKPGFLSRLTSAIGFAPGEYTIRIVGGYWLDQKKIRTPDGYRSETAEIKVKIGSPQHVILLGAAVGGLIAALLSIFTAKEQLPETRLFARVVRAMLQIISAPLLAATVTILLSRLADAPLPIRVSVNDFWGSIAIGFIAAMWGPMILKKLVPKGAEAQTTNEPTREARPPAPQAPAPLPTEVAAPRTS